MNAESNSQDPERRAPGQHPQEAKEQESSPWAEMLKRKREWSATMPDAPDEEVADLPDPERTEGAPVETDLAGGSASEAGSVREPDVEKAPTLPTQPVPRMVNEEDLRQHVDSLWRHLALHHSGPMQCPHKTFQLVQTCEEPATCPNVFKCGGLPFVSEASKKIGVAVAIVLGVILLIEALAMIVILPMVYYDVNMENIWIRYVVGPLVGTPLIVYLLSVSWRARDKRRKRFLRSVAEACSRLGLNYGGWQWIANGALPLAHSGPLGNARAMMWGEVEGTRVVVLHYETREFETMVYLFPDELLLGDLIAVTRLGGEISYCSFMFGRNEVPVERLPQYFIAAASPEYVTPLQSESLIGTLNKSPGWQLQLLGGRLFAWQQRWTSRMLDGMPSGADGVEAGVRAAVRMRQELGKADPV